MEKICKYLLYLHWRVVYGVKTNAHNVFVDHNLIFMEINHKENTRVIIARKTIRWTSLDGVGQTPKCRNIRVRFIIIRVIIINRILININRLVYDEWTNIFYTALRKYNTCVIIFSVIYYYIIIGTNNRPLRYSIQSI